MKQDKIYHRNWRRKNPEQYRKYCRDRYWSSELIRKRRSEIARGWYLRNRPEIRKQQKEYYQNNKQTLNKQALKNYHKNAEKINKARREKYQLNKTLSSVPRLEDVPCVYNEPIDI